MFDTHDDPSHYYQPHTDGFHELDQPRMELTHFTGRVHLYDARPGEDRWSLALEFNDETGDDFILLIHQVKGDTLFYKGSTTPTWNDLRPPTRR